MSTDTADVGIRKEGPRGAFGRRALIRGTGLGAAGLAAAALLGCGSKKKEEAKAPAPGTSGTAAAPASNDPRYPKDPNLKYPFNFPEPNKPPKAGGTMRVAVSWDVSTEDPTKSAAGGTVVVPNNVYNRLLQIKGGPEQNPFKLEIGPELAQSWETTPDGLTYTFKIRPGIKWQNVAPLNGRPFVAADAKFAYERYRTEGVHKSYWVNVDKIDAPDPATLKITLTKPTPEFEIPLASRYQTIFPKETVDDGTIDKKIVGTGPMIVKEITAGSQVTMTANPDYWRRKVLLDGVEYKIMPDTTSRVAQFRAKQVDYGYGIASTNRELEALKQTIPDLQIHYEPVSAGGGTFGLNLSNPKFADVRIRRALNLAIDRKSIFDTVYEGVGLVNATSIPWIYFFDAPPTDLGPWNKFDIPQAKQLLQAAGVPDFSFEFIYYAYAATNEQITELLISQFRNAGITMKGGKVDYTTYNSQWVGAKLPEATTVGWQAQGFDANTYFYNPLHSKSPGNRNQLKDPQIDEWAAAQAVEIDPKKRKEIQRKIYDRELDQVYRNPMTVGTVIETYQPWLRGIRFGGILGSNSYYYDWGAQVEGAWLDK